MSLSLSESGEEIAVGGSAHNGQRPGVTPPTRPRRTAASVSASRMTAANAFADPLSDYSEEIPVPTFSDSSADIGIISTPAQTQARLGYGASAVTSGDADTAAAGAEIEPEWVRNYNPPSADNQDRRAAFLASLEDNDEDSVIDLISQELDGNASEDVAKAAEVEKEAAQNISAKRGKGLKPKNRLPLSVVSKLDENLVLLQSEGDGLDLSGDVGAVGRVKIQEGELLMDIKGVVYNALLRKCNTMCVVNVGDEEARVTAVFDEAVTLTCKRNLFDSDEIVVHGKVDESIADIGDAGALDEEAVHNSKKRKTGEGKAKSKAKASANHKGSDSSKRIAKVGRRKK
eukprot:GFKZ01003741.1.p1 GENE.GFKZ01003741.1~~GFKZ01003741.1.p1  ORF type:complete len:344 (+),score=73.95 GFKZ01003741.1:272-1303(+)